MFALPYSSLTAKGISDAIKKCKMGQFVLLLLHNADAKTTSMFQLYGREINNALGSDFALLTSYDEKMINSGYMGKDEILSFQSKLLERSDNMDRQIRNYAVMLKLAREYHIEPYYMPALCVIDTSNWKNETEMTYVIPLAKKEDYEMKDTILRVIQILRNNYGSARNIGMELLELCPRSTASKHQSTAKDTITNSFAKTFKKLLREHNENIQTISYTLSLSEKTVSRCINGDTIPNRNRMIAFAVAGHFYPDELDNLLERLEYAKLCKGNRRDDLIAECLNNQESFKKTNERLSELRLAPLMPAKKTKK